MKAQDVAQIIGAREYSVANGYIEIENLLTDSRRLTETQGTVFFAIPTKRNTGCNYIEELYGKGVRSFVMPLNVDERMRAIVASFRDVNVWYVQDVVRSMQTLAASHRALYDIPVVGITGSNGKTIVKDWLVQLMSPDRQVIASPKSYNSQIGVPLSVWQMKSSDSIGVFEAGISELGEMENLRNVINPTVGILTNIGAAHDENFISREQKLAEKLQLFTQCKALIYCSDYIDVHSVVSGHDGLRKVQKITWGHKEDNFIRLTSVEYGSKSSVLKIRVGNEESNIEIPFLDFASVENAMHCITFMLYMGYSVEVVKRRCLSLLPVEMRLEMNEGVNDCLLINDGYSLDMNSLTIALDFIQCVQQHNKRTLILSDFVQTGMVESELYSQVAQLVKQKGITKFIGVGEALMRNKYLFSDLSASFYPTTDSFLLDGSISCFNNETILLKGARRFRFENIAKILQRKSHETIMEVNLNAIVSNLNYFRSRVNPSTRIMAMVKAASYGMGKVEVANVLQFNHVDYLTVAYSDEGVELRRNGITLPIMVMNPEEESFADMVRYHLEPDIYSFRIFDMFSSTVRAFGDSAAPYPVHVELDTGMHRLGFGEDDILNLLDKLKSNDNVLQVKSIFSHLACSEDASMDGFTNGQITKFKQWSDRIKYGLGDETILCHILNSSGIVRFTDAQMDMVRLGIGLYGISPDPAIQSLLTPVCCLKTKISQLKFIQKDDTVGYNRRWVAERDSHIAIIPIGYADGFARRLGYGRAFVTINGCKAPIIGSICMDMCFADVTGISCKEGDDVVVFGDSDSINQLSSAADTIPYEIFTSISQRVKRVYYQE